MNQHSHPAPMGSRWMTQGRMEGFPPANIVTVQLNVTLDVHTKTYKHVCVLRDPIDQVELARTGSRERALSDMITDIGQVIPDLWDLLQTWYPDVNF